MEQHVGKAATATERGRLWTKDMDMRVLGRKSVSAEVGLPATGTWKVLVRV